MRKHYWSDGFIRMQAQHYIVGGILERDVFKKLYYEHKINIIDCWNTFLGKDESYFYDEIHLSPKGNKLVADYISEMYEYKNKD